MPAIPNIVTVSLNPAIDRTIEVEHLTIGAHQRGREIRRTPGGKGVNVSRTLSTLGLRNVATGFLGDQNRAELAPLFDKTHVLDEFFTLPGRTRENVTLADRASRQETHIRDRGLEVPPAALDRLTKKLAMLAGDQGLVIFSGSLPPGVGPADFARLVDACIAAGARVAVDTSGPALRAVADRPLWLVKPNAAELADLVGRELHDMPQRIHAAKELNQTIHTVLLTCGARGAVLFAPGIALHAMVDVPPPLRVANTVGCGDVLLGAFVAAVWQGRPLDDALVRAVAAAAASACTVSPAEFDDETLRQLRDNVRLTEV